MEKTADIYINIPVKSISRPYTYLIPEQFDILQAGCRVLVPFGGRLMEGFIIKIYDYNENNAINITKLKKIRDIIDTQPWFTSNMFAVAKWMADFYLCSLGETMRLFIPGKNSVKIRPVFNVNEKIFLTEDRRKLSDGQKHLYDYIKVCKNTDLLMLRRSFGASEGFTADLEKLINKNFVVKSYIYRSQANKIYTNYAVLNVEVDNKVLETLKRKPAQKKALVYLSTVKEADVADLKRQHISSAILEALARMNYIKLEKRQILRDSYKNMLTEKTRHSVLTDEQQTVMNKIEENLVRGKNEFLLFGVTGSGKTRIYIETALKIRALGKQVLVLVPEIVLTGQLVMSFKQYFADDVAVIHSRLSVNERNDTFWRIRTGQAGVIIGARSALFAPFESLGLIVMDEEHDSSYKQDESPRYHAHDVAEKTAQIYNAVLLLGSATPSLESFYKAQNGKYVLLTMKERIDNIPMPFIECVDMREELKHGNRKILSRKLKELIESTLAKKQQMIIMLNRRGFSTFVMCRSCGYVMRCRQCNLPLVYHKRGGLKCHHCDITEPVPDICPKCSSRYIKFFGSGTEKLEEELARTFPHARTIRLDRDTTGRKFAHQDILKQFKAGLYDILLGTQMVAKGHDIPNVTGVGIISADSSLNMPDFRAGERTFALITQTAGRAGRGHEKGRVVLQTYNPEHYAVQCGINQDYPSFYQKELIMREMLYYPPFCSLIKLVFQNEIEEKALSSAVNFKTEMEKYFNDTGIEIMGPAPAVISKFKDIYRFNLLIKTNNQSVVNDFLRRKNVDTDKDITIDVNPINTN